MIPPALATAEVPEVLPSPPLSASARGRCSPCSGTGTMLLGHCFAGVSHCSASAALAHTELNAFNLSTPLKLLQLTSPMLAVFAERKRVNIPVATYLNQIYLFVVVGFFHSQKERGNCNACFLL